MTPATHARRGREIARLILSIAAENPELRFMQILENALASWKAANPGAKDCFYVEDGQVVRALETFYRNGKPKKGS